MYVSVLTIIVIHDLLFHCSHSSIHNFTFALAQGLAHFSFVSQFFIQVKMARTDVNAEEAEKSEESEEAEEPEEEVDLHVEVMRLTVEVERLRNLHLDVEWLNVEVEKLRRLPEKVEKLTENVEKLTVQADRLEGFMLSQHASHRSLWNLYNELR